MTRLTLTLLGGFAAHVEDGDPCALSSQKARALLAFLAMPAGQAHPREKLMTLLWGDHPDRQAAQNLRQALFRIRRDLAGAAKALEVGPGTVSLAKGAVVVDASEFERLASRTDSDALERALALYRGDLLDGFNVDSPEWEAWRRTERERLHELAVEAFARLLAEQIQAGVLDRAIETAARLLAIDPLQEPVHRALMRLYDRRERRAAALRQYQVCVIVLHRELGVEPDADTRALYLEILRRQDPTVAGLPAEPPSPSPLGTRLGAVSTGTEVPLVGRGHEITRLGRALDDAAAGRGSTVLLSGEAGIGKTCLLSELVAEAHRRGFRTLVARCHQSEQVLPFRSIVDALRDGRALQEADVTGLSAADRAELPRLFPELGGAEVLRGTNPHDHARLFEAIDGLLGDLSAGGPVVLAIEDAQWADDMTLRLVAFLSRRLRRRRLALAVTVRDDDLDDAPTLKVVLDELDRDPATVRIALGPLARQDALDLVGALAPGRGGDDWVAVAERVWEISGGNPFVIVEATRDLAERGVREVASQAPIPRRVRELVRARLGRFPAYLREIAAVAAVAGGPVPFDVLVGASRRSDREVAEAVEQLVRRRVLQSVGESFAFSHDRIQQVVYDDVLVPRRRALHAAVAAALEARGHDAAAETADQLAHHYALAGEAQRAVAALIVFAERAARRHALDAAVRALRDALDQAAGVPDAAGDRMHLDLVFRLCHWLYIMGKIPETLTLLEACRARAERTLDPAVLGPFHFWLGHTLGFLGRRAEVEPHVEQAVAHARAAGDRPTLGKASYALGLAGYWGGRPGAGAERCREAIALLEGADEPWWLGQAYWMLGYNLLMLGEHDLVLGALQQIDGVARRMGDTRLAAYAAWTAGYAYARTGEFTRGLETCRRARELATDPLHQAWADVTIGVVYVEMGDAPQAIAHLDRGLRVFIETGGFQYHQGHFTSYLAAAHAIAGDLDTADTVAREGITLGESVGFLGATGRARRVRGLVAAARANHAEAERWLRDAAADFRAGEQWFQLSRAELDLADVLDACARHAEARELAAEARRGFVTQRNAHWIRRADVALARLAATGGS